MLKKFKGIEIQLNDIKHGKKCNIISFNEETFNENQFNALCKQYDKLGFLPCSFKYKNDKVDVYFDTTNLISLNEYFNTSNIIKEMEFIDILKTISQSIKSSSNFIYFTDKNFVIDGDLMYIDPEDKSIHIMYLPIKQNISTCVVNDFKALVIEWINYRVRINGQSIAQDVLQEMRNPSFNLDQFTKFLNSLHKEVVKEIPSPSKIIVEPVISYPTISSNSQLKQTVIQPVTNLTPINKHEEPKKRQGFFSKWFGLKSKNGIQDSQIQNNIHNFVEEESYDTEVLDLSEYLIDAFLIGNNEKIQINKAEFIVGRMKEVADYIIANKAVGKVHAKFIIKDNKIYLVDLDSKNGTYIDNVKLNSQAMYEVKNGNRITFANSTYTLNIME